MRRIVLVAGTRPEAIKLAPVHFALEQADGLESVFVSSGQHRELLDSALTPLGIVPQHGLDVMLAGQTPSDVLCRVVERLTALLERQQPQALLVQGDTTTALASTLAAYHMRIPVGHVEAGLRTYDQDNPFPEEANRQLIDRLASWCFVPTEPARQHLLDERIPAGRIHLTGNTIVDALVWAEQRSTYRCPPDTLLITLHRRESFGEPLRNILLGLTDFLRATPGARALWPVHPNPNVAGALKAAGDAMRRIEQVLPLDYLAFCGALASCRLVLSDSGGVQEEAPSLGKTVLVARDTTERPEGLSGARNRLVGRTREGVRQALEQAWSEPSYAGPLPAPNPFGDGTAGQRIVEILARES